MQNSLLLEAKSDGSDPEIHIARARHKRLDMPEHACT